MNQAEETFFKGELNPELNTYLKEKSMEEFLSILEDEKVLFILGYPEENTPFHYIENKNTGKKYIMSFTSLDDLNVWKEKAGIEKPSITLGKMNLIYTLASMDEIQELGGIVFDPCTLNKIMDISLFLERISRPEGTILRTAKNAPTEWIRAMESYFKKEKSIQKVYLQVEAKEEGERYLIILDIDSKKRDKILCKIASLSEKYADLPVVYADLKANPTLETTLEPFYKK